MTEYEIADLGQQQYALLQTQQAVVSVSIGLIMLTIFGYVIAAHFIGPRFSRVQTRLLSTLYVAWVAYQSLDLYVSIEVSKTIAVTFLSLSPGAAPKRLYDYYMDGNIESLQYAMIFLALLGSLYFMWSVRQARERVAGCATNDTARMLGDESGR